MRLHTTFAIVIGICLLAAAASAMTGYTNRALFDSAIAGYTQHTVTNFDAQADGSSAASYGSLSISASGLASDGSTPIVLPPIATASHLAASAPNSLGVFGEDHEFLAGNGDRITFNFSVPVHAFGAYLIGNPTPTGSPPIPFWRMQVSGFDAYSATDPLYSLDTGNDVYFLGIVSADQPFSTVTLCSDNDPNAVFSFNADDLVYATLPDEISLLQAKSMSSGYVRVKAIVTRVHSDRFNIELADRSMGIMVRGTGAVRGEATTLLGNLMDNGNGERCIELTQIIARTRDTPPTPLAMGSRAVGGSNTVGLQIGVPGSCGPNNVGLDAQVWGRVTAIAPDYSWVTIDDGAGRPLIPGVTGVVLLGKDVGARRWIGQYLVARGSVTLVDYETTHLPAIRVAAPEDIWSP